MMTKTRTSLSSKCTDKKKMRTDILPLLITLTLTVGNMMIQSTESFQLPFSSSSSSSSLLLHAAVKNTNNKHHHDQHHKMLLTDDDGDVRFQHNKYNTIDNDDQHDIIDETRRRSTLMVLGTTFLTVSSAASTTGVIWSSMPSEAGAVETTVSRAESAISDDLSTVSTTEFVTTEERRSSSPSLSTSTTTTTTSSSDILLSDAATVAASTSLPPSTTVDWKSIFQKAGKRALGSGKAGATASVVQVLSLMWLRTSMNYQYRYGGNLKSSLTTLWEEGGVGRLYQGLPFALVQGPLTRFGDTAANVGILALLETIPETRELPLPIKTACGSISAGLWRILLMPLDASKTSLQVEGQDGLSKLWSLVRKEGPAPLYYGALAQASATAAGHWPWFLTFNYVDKTLPVVSASDDLLLSLVRSAFLGFCASCVSDVVSNSLRVIKTTKQTARLSSGEIDVDDDSTSSSLDKSMSSATATTTTDTFREPSYPEIVSMILEKDGINGLLFRGLQTRLLTNSIQGALFSVVWKYLQQTSS